MNAFQYDWAIEAQFIAKNRLSSAKMAVQMGWKGNKKTDEKNAESAFVEDSSKFFTEKSVVSKKNLGFLVNNQLVKEKCRYSSMTMCFTWYLTTKCFLYATNEALEQ